LKRREDPTREDQSSGAQGDQEHGTGITARPKKAIREYIAHSFRGEGKCHWRRTQTKEGFTTPFGGRGRSAPKEENGMHRDIPLVYWRRVPHATRNALEKEGVIYLLSPL